MAVHYKNVGNTARAMETGPAAGKKPAASVKRRRAVRFMYMNDHRHKLSALTVITLILIFAGATGAAVSSANVTVARGRVMTLNNELREIQSQNNSLREEAKRYDDAISMREAAQDRLGMAEPKPYQILHINVPEENYAEYAR